MTYHVRFELAHKPNEGRDRKAVLPGYISSVLQHFSEPLSCMKHSCLDRAFVDTENCGYFCDRSALVIYQSYDFAMFEGKAQDASAQL
jgi:hypothetical protein